MSDKLVDVFLLIFQTRDQTSASPHFAEATCGRPIKPVTVAFCIPELYLRDLLRSVSHEASCKVGNYYIFFKTKIIQDTIK